MTRSRGFSQSVAALAVAAGCGSDPQMERSQGGRAVTVSGGFVAGVPDSGPAGKNPFEGDRQALADGRRLYAWFNCAGCHGMQGGGGIGPPFADDVWIYGGSPSQIFLSIAQGRPNGMPAFGTKLADKEIWEIALYVQSLGSDRPPP